MTYQEELKLSTRGHGQMTDLSAQVAEVVARSEISRGVVHLFNVGSTAVLTTIEFEPGLEEDLPQILNTLIPPGRQYGHERAWHDGNAHSHLQASIMGPGLTVPFQEGRLLLGTWQQIVHLECDNKPRKRSIIATVFGD